LTQDWQRNMYIRSAFRVSTFYSYASHLLQSPTSKHLY
jgi:hypothetical protein